MQCNNTVISSMHRRIIRLVIAFKCFLFTAQRIKIDLICTAMQQYIYLFKTQENHLNIQCNAVQRQKRDMLLLQCTTECVNYGTDCSAVQQHVTVSFMHNGIHGLTMHILWDMNCNATAAYSITE